MVSRIRFVGTLALVALVAAAASMSSTAVAQQAAPAPAARAQQPARDGLTPASPRDANDGRGPFKTLVIRGAMLIDGSGAPPQGPVDVVVQGNRIASIRSAGTPGIPLRPNRQRRCISGRNLCD